MTDELFTVELKGFQEFFAALQNSPSICADVSQKIMKRMTLMAKGTAQENAPVDKGILRSSLTDQVQGSRLDTVGRVGTTISYATFQELGTGIYGPKGEPIRPVNRKFLQFQTKDGKWIRAREVKGTPAKGYLQKGLAEVMNKLGDIKTFGGNLLVQQLKQAMKL
jgi:hypothetical protein